MEDTDFPSAQTLHGLERSTPKACWLACLTNEECGAAIFFGSEGLCNLKREPLGKGCQDDGATALMSDCPDDLEVDDCESNGTDSK